MADEAGIPDIPSRLLDDPAAPAARPAAWVTVIAPRHTAPTPEAMTAAPAATVPMGEMMSDPCSEGVPPRTLARSFGVCQQSAAKISDAPMIENASVAGCMEFAIFSACASHVDESVMPVLINR